MDGWNGMGLQWMDFQKEYALNGYVDWAKGGWMDLCPAWFCLATHQQCYGIGWYGLHMFQGGGEGPDAEVGDTQEEGYDDQEGSDDDEGPAKGRASPTPHLTTPTAATVSMVMTGVVGVMLSAGGGYPPLSVMERHAHRERSLSNHLPILCHLFTHGINCLCSNLLKTQVFGGLNATVACNSSCYIPNTMASSDTIIMIIYSVK